jgi:hypothetical protein
VRFSRLFGKCVACRPCTWRWFDNVCSVLLCGSQDEIVESLKFNARGLVGMANKGPDTNGSQFFIAYQKLPHLNMKYPIFGK